MSLKSHHSFKSYDKWAHQPQELSWNDTYIMHKLHDEMDTIDTHLVNELSVFIFIQCVIIKDVVDSSYIMPQH